MSACPATGETCPYAACGSSSCEPPPCPKCGKPEDSFACRIRHIHLNTGDAKAARDVDGGKR